MRAKGRFRHSARRGLGAAIAAVMTAVLFNIVEVPAAEAESDPGPTVPLPNAPSTPVDRQTMEERQSDQAADSALTGDQPASDAPDGAGTYSATSLSPSSTWDVSAQTGTFTWSYPMGVPPSPGGLDPDLALSYSSALVDGKTSGTNPQASWVGDGWDLSAGFIERQYGLCVDDEDGDRSPADVGDLCWRTDNAVLSYGAGAGSLIEADDGTWKLESDDGTRIERLTGAGNGDDDGEHWKITALDGTRYYFGSRPESESTWTVPVFGDDSGEPCRASAFDDSHCEQAWRWNLDKVVDANGNAIHYEYRIETNSYGMNGEEDAVSYIRGGTLETIEYGIHPDAPTPTAKVDFSVADRCVPGSDCTRDKPDNWPDVPWDWHCDEPECDKYSPTFWTSKRLAKVTTQVRSGSSYTEVDSWELEHQYPDPGDGEKATLWLGSVTRTGHVGGTAVMEPVTFAGAAKPNRVYGEDGVAMLNRYRLVGIVSESGGVTSIQYAEPDCDIDAPPSDPEGNTKRCFPVEWAPPDHNERTDYFHKYVVEQVSESDRIGSTTDAVTRYEYLGGAAWHESESEFVDDEDEVWNDFRGYGRVRVMTGAAEDPSGPPTVVERRFYRGMERDPLVDSEGGTRTDHEWLNGFEYESIAYEGIEGAIVSKTISTPNWQGPTAERGDLEAYIVRTGSTSEYTALANGWRTTRAEFEYDAYGLVTQTDDLGDTDVETDDQCSTVEYARDPEKGMIGFVSEERTVAVDCDTAPDLPGDLISWKRHLYDEGAFAAAPTTGNVTETRTAHGAIAGVPLFRTEASFAYDPHGRPVSATDALDRTTTTAYTPETGGPVTGTSSTDAKGHTTTVEIHPARGQVVSTVDPNGRRTEATADPLGRTTAVWQPNRQRAYGAGPSVKYEYSIHRDEPSAVITHTLNYKGDYVTSSVVYDGLLRVRQAQSPASGDGRLLTDTRYDSQGRPWKTTSAFFNDREVDDQLWLAGDAEIHWWTSTEYDGAGRPVAQIDHAGVEERWRTAIAYEGDRVHVTPPDGGTATTQITDARGQLTELRRYHGGTPSGEFDATAYTYTDAGQLEAVTDPAGNEWSYEYDLFGRPIRVDDPDKGVSTLAYDEVGQVVSTTDARGVTLEYEYDELGRRTRTTHEDRTLAEWTYDTVIKGKGHLATATRYVDGAAYTTSVRLYDALYRPISAAVTIPETEETLAGTYVSGVKYHEDGSPRNMTLPELGDLPKETVTWEYDGLSSPVGMTGSLAGSAATDVLVAETEYTRYGELARLHLGQTPNQVWQSFYYQTDTRRLSRMIVDGELPRPMLADLNYEYDDAGNPVSIADTPKEQPADVQCFEYDHLRRLTEAWTPSDGCDAAPSEEALDGPAPYWQSFTYDSVGNRLTERLTTPQGTTDRAYEYSEAGDRQAHALRAMTETGPEGTREYSYAYDEAGNTVDRSLPDSEQTLEWDPEGRLARAVVDGESVEFVYGPAGNRLIKRDSSGSTLYLGDQELHLDAETGELTATRYYRYGGRTIAMREADTGLTWLADDHQGTSQMSVGADDMTVEQRRQMPFGDTRGDSPDLAADRGFVGGAEDTELGLVHLGAREYDPLTGRFISVDPVMDLSDSQQMHGYTYGNNNPVANADPTGLAPEDSIDDVIDIIQDIGDNVDTQAAVDALRGLGPLGKRIAKRIPVIGPAYAVYDVIETCSSGFDVDCAISIVDALPAAGEVARAVRVVVDSDTGRYVLNYLRGGIIDGDLIMIGDNEEIGAAVNVAVDTIVKGGLMQAGSMVGRTNTLVNVVNRASQMCIKDFTLQAGSVCGGVYGVKPDLVLGPWTPPKPVVQMDVRWSPRSVFAPDDRVVHRPSTGGSPGVRTPSSPPVGKPDDKGNFTNQNGSRCNTAARGQCAF